MKDSYDDVGEVAAEIASCGGRTFAVKGDEFRHVALIRELEESLPVYLRSSKSPPWVLGWDAEDLSRRDCVMVIVLELERLSERELCAWWSMLCVERESLNRGKLRTLIVGKERDFDALYQVAPALLDQTEVFRLRPGLRPGNYGMMISPEG